MKTEIKKMGDAIVVSVEGKLNFETNEPFRKDLGKLIDRTKTDSVPKRIIFDLENLDFVGSSGITGFVQTLKDFNDRVDLKPKYAAVKSEFKKVIKAMDETAGFEFYEDKVEARKSWDN